MDYSKTIVIMYDFDKTLSKSYMSEYGFIKNLGFKSNDEFFDYCNITIAKSYNMDNILAFLLAKIIKAKEHKIKLTKSYLNKMGKNIEFFDGVETWFKRINDYAKSLGYKVEHYLISSGITEIIEGCSIYNQFKKVFASSFAYNEKGEAFWPKQVVNYTAKTQYIFRIKKGLINDLTNDEDINKKYNSTNSVVPYKNMIYIGDGQTDVPCMKLVKEKGGHSICLHNGTQHSLKVAKQIYGDGRVNKINIADYSENADLEKYVKNIIKNIK